MLSRRNEFRECPRIDGMKIKGKGTSSKGRQEVGGFGFVWRRKKKKGVISLHVSATLNALQVRLLRAIKYTSVAGEKERAIKGGIKSGGRRKERNKGPNALKSPETLITNE